MTFSSRVKRPTAAAWTEPLYWLDAIIAFINLEKRLIVQQVVLQSAKSPLVAFTISIRVYLVVMLHAFFYWAIDREMTDISYIDFNAAAFGLWTIIGQMEKKAVPSLFPLPSNIPLQIRWINLFIADLVWVTLKSALGISAVYLTFVLFPNPALTGFAPHWDVPMIILLVILAGLFGAGIGMTLHAITVAVPALEGAAEVFAWFMFISSGIYDTYTTLPEIVRPIFVFNPAMTIIEMGRRALNPGYPTGDLTLTYPVCATFVLLIVGFLLNRHVKRVEVP
jgi:ABC-type polysaccharide/polyol phosphate export permease